MTTEETQLTTEEPVVDAAAVEATTTEETPDAQAVSSVETTKEEAPAYEPNYSFKVQDRELEFDDWVKPLVKDKESEDFYRDVMNKVHGIEHIQAKRDELRQTLETEQATRGQLDQSLKTLSHYVETDNMDAFFQALQIPEDQIMRYVAKRLQYQDMSPEERSQYDNGIVQNQETYNLQQQNLQLQQNYNQMVYEQRMNELDNVMSRPDIAQAAQAFDARSNKPGAFREEVINRGRYHAQVAGKDLTAEQAVTELMGLIGANMPNPATNTVEAQNQAANTPQGGRPAPTKKPVIPRVDASGGSPAKRVVKSMADLKAARESLAR